MYVEYKSTMLLYACVLLNNKKLEKNLDLDAYITFLSTQVYVSK